MNNTKKLMQQTKEAFDLKGSEFFQSVKKKALEYIGKKEWDQFRTLVETFNVLKKLKADDDFLSKLYSLYQELIETQAYEEAAAISKMFKFSMEKRLTPVQLVVNRLLRNNNDEDVLRILKIFKIRASTLRKVFSDEYYRRLLNREGSIQDFRKTFRLSISDVGLTGWLFGEVYDSPMLRRIFIGKKN